MGTFNFADRYAEAGLAPNAQVITAREAPASRIVDNITDPQILALAAVYYESSDVELTWLRDEFAKEDASFSLVNNARETRVLAAVILGELIANESNEAILAVITGNVAGHRQSSQCEWLISDAKNFLGKLSVSHRKPGKIETKITSAVTPKLAEEIAEVSDQDWDALRIAVGKIRTESISSNRTTSSQTTSALNELSRQLSYMREESQILWWLFGGHSRLLKCSFASLSIPQAAIVGAVDLGSLTTYSSLGPVAAPAVLERVLLMAKKSKAQTACELAAAIDGLSAEHLDCLTVYPEKLPPRIAPITAAIDMARTMGTGNWHARFKAKTGFDASLQFEPLELSEQLYFENLLGQLQ